MNSRSKKLLCGVIAILMVLAILPVASLAEKAADQVTELKSARRWSNVWDYLDAVEAEMLQKGAAPQEVTMAVYKAALVCPFIDQGSISDLDDNGFSFTANGMHGGYDYKIRNTPFHSSLNSAAYQTISAAASARVSTASTKNAPTSNNVLLVGPWYSSDSSFTDQYKTEASTLATDLGGTCTQLTNSNATGPNIAAAYLDKAIVIYDSHGAAYNSTSYLCLTSSTGLTTSDYNNGWAYNGGSWYGIDGRYIQNHVSGTLSNCLVWMAICEGMKLSGGGKTGTGLLAAGAGVVYGYSQSVSFTGDYKYEAYFWNRMREGKTVAQAYAAMTSYYGNWDPAYSSSSGAAWPIVMSSVDAFPSNPDSHQTVYSDWTMFPETTPVDPTATPTAAPTATPTAAPTAAPTTAPSTDTYYMPTTTIETGVDYLIGYTDGTNTYLLMNYNPNKISNYYYYSSSSNYYGYGIKAQMSGTNVVGVDTSTYGSATLTNVTWQFIANGSYYKIRSGYNTSYYLRVYSSSSYADLYAGSGTSYATNWSWNASTQRLSYYVSSSVTKYATYIPTAGSYSNFFGAPTSATTYSTITLYKKVSGTVTPTAAPTATPTAAPTATPTAAPTTAPSTGTYYTPVTSITTGTEYLIGYSDGTNTYLLMNYCPDTSNHYYYSSSSNYYGYAVRAVMDGNNVVGVDTTTLSSATLDHVEWKFVSNGSYYKIQSGYNSSYYLRVYKSSSYADCYPASGTSYATNWKYSNNMLSYYVSSSVTKYMKFYSGAADDYGFFGAPTSGGSTIVLFKKVG